MEGFPFRIYSLRRLVVVVVVVVVWWERICVTHQRSLLFHIHPHPSASIRPYTHIPLRIHIEFISAQHEPNTIRTITTIMIPYPHTRHRETPKRELQPRIHARCRHHHMQRYYIAARATKAHSSREYTRLWWYAAPESRESIHILCWVEHICKYVLYTRCVVLSDCEPKKI